MNLDSAPQAAQESRSRAAVRSKRTGSRTTPPIGERDYVAIADRFARDAIADVDQLRNCHWIRLAASRYVKDRKRAAEKSGPFRFSRVHANNYCDLIEKLPHVEGKWKDADGNDAPYIILHPAHIFFIVNLFGFRQHDGTRRFTTALLSSARKNAKALALDTPVATPTGWLTIAGIHVGDRVFAANGAACTVRAVSELFIGKPCYRLRFSDGSHIIASGDHLWETSHHRGFPAGRSVTSVQTTEEIAHTVRVPRSDNKVEYNHSIPVAAALQTDNVELPLDPYMLGAWLGDGTTAAAHLTCGDADLEHMTSEVRRVVGGNPVIHHYRTAWRIGLTTGRGGRAVKIHSILRNLGVLGNKHIPESYLWAGTGQRRALLQGLMDTDGTVTHTGKSGAVSCAFTSTKRCLAEGALQLARSLGIKATLAERTAKLRGMVIGPSYLVQFTAWADDAVFRLPRKAGRLKPRPIGNRRSGTIKIESCERVESVPTKCIEVDSADHLFLAGQGMIRTHNSTIAAAILLACQCLEDEEGAQVISAATTGSQARIVFNVAKRMVEKTPDLREEFSLEPFANAIANWQMGSNFRPINAKASTQDGLNPSHTCLDEIHAHKNGDLLNVLKSAAGARLNALWLYTTTEGYETPGPWPELRQFAHQVLSGIVEADHFLALIFALDEQVGEPGQPGYRPADADFDESKWPKANPLMEVNPILEREIRKAAIEAKQMPGTHAEFKIKRLNRQAASATTWLNIERWKRCNGAVDLAFLEGKDCWAALDGAATTDLMAFRLVWRVDGIVYTWGRRWVPVDAVAQRTERGTVPYAGWVDAGLIVQLPGNIIDYAYVEKDIVELAERFKPKIIGYDSWNIRDLINRLTVKLPSRQAPDGKTKSILEEFRQGPRSFNPAMKECERLYLAGNFRHGGDAVLNWCASNVVPRYDENMNSAPDRKKSADKIDDAVAMFMAIGVMGAPPVEEKKYQVFFA